MKLGRGPLVSDLFATRQPGCCVICDRTLPKRRRVLCGHPDCHRGWMALYQADRRAFYGSSRP